MKEKYFFLGISFVFSVAYWFLESLIHFFGYGEAAIEIIPSDFNELWMRSLIVALVILVGFFADRHAGKIKRKETEKEEIYRTMLRATNHILNNFLNNMLLPQTEAEAGKSKDFSPELLTLYAEVIEDTKQQIVSLSDIDKPSKETIEERYNPKS